MYHRHGWSSCWLCYRTSGRGAAMLAAKASQASWMQVCQPSWHTTCQMGPACLSQKCTRRPCRHAAAQLCSHKVCCAARRCPDINPCTARWEVRASRGGQPCGTLAVATPQRGVCTAEESPQGDWLEPLCACPWEPAAARAVHKAAALPADSAGTPFCRVLHCL
jgi:hypothetical protein